MPFETLNCKFTLNWNLLLACPKCRIMNVIFCTYTEPFSRRRINNRIGQKVKHVCAPYSVFEFVKNTTNSLPCGPISRLHLLLPKSSMVRIFKFLPSSLVYVINVLKNLCDGEAAFVNVPELLQVLHQPQDDLLQLLEKFDQNGG